MKYEYYKLLSYRNVVRYFCNKRNTIMFGIVVFPPFASLRIFFIFRKKINIRKSGFPPPIPKENQGKKL